MFIYVVCNCCLHGLLERIPVENKKWTVRDPVSVIALGIRQKLVACTPGETTSVLWKPALSLESCQVTNCCVCVYLCMDSNWKHCVLLLTVTDTFT